MIADEVPIASAASKPRGPSRRNTDARAPMIGVRELKAQAADGRRHRPRRLAPGRGPHSHDRERERTAAESTATETWREGSRRCASVPVTLARTCDGRVMPRFDSVHAGRPGVRRIGTRRAPPVTRSRVACSGVTGGRCPGPGGLGEQFAAGHLITDGFEIVERKLRTPAPGRSIRRAPSDLEAEIGGRAGLERGVRVGNAATRPTRDMRRAATRTLPGSRAGANQRCLTGARQVHAAVGEGDQRAAVTGLTRDPTRFVRGDF
jgi:hypothetical protein